jgi:hypothetical protein
MTASAASGTIGAGDAVVAVGDEGGDDSALTTEGAGGRAEGGVSFAFSVVTRTGVAGAGAGVGAAGAGTGSFCWMTGEAAGSEMTTTGELGGGADSGAATTMGGAGGGDGGFGSEAGGVIAFSSVGSAVGTATTEPS